VPSNGLFPAVRIPVQRCIRRRGCLVSVSCVIDPRSYILLLVQGPALKVSGKHPARGKHGRPRVNSGFPLLLQAIIALQIPNSIADRLIPRKGARHFPAQLGTARSAALSAAAAVSSALPRHRIGRETAFEGYVVPPKGLPCFRCERFYRCACVGEFDIFESPDILVVLIN
jgi:hypothetical protein